MILSGDIGGTKTVLALYEPGPDGFRSTAKKSFPSANFASLEEVITAFLAEHPSLSLEGACFGVAGPVHAGTAKLTNLPWMLNEHELARALHIPKVRLLNDLTAAAYGMLCLRPDEFHALQGDNGLPPDGSIAIIAPGTGLGEAILYFDSVCYHALPSEGGHTDFAPTNDDEIALFNYLRRTLGPHVSYERILSGAGISAVYAFVRQAENLPEPEWLSTQRQTGDPNAAITQAALEHRDPICEKTLDLFCHVLGAEAGNLALKCMASAVVLGGGIPPKILPQYTGDAFLRGFTEKGRFSGWMRSLPVLVAMNPLAPLLGAAYYLTSQRIHRKDAK
jgi:glucokinase